MKRITVLLVAAFLISVCFLVSASSQEDMEIVDNGVFEAPRRAPAVFRHDTHNEKAEVEECNECHHLYEDGKKLEDESSEDQRCADCHGTRDDGAVPSLRKAYHRNCKGCHLEKSAGPVMCGECHIK